MSGWVFLERVLLLAFQLHLPLRLLLFQQSVHSFSSALPPQLRLERIHMPPGWNHSSLPARADFQWIELLQCELFEGANLDQCSCAVWLPHWLVLEWQHLHQLPSWPSLRQHRVHLRERLFPC